VITFFLLLTAFSAYNLVAGTPYRATYGFCFGVNLTGLVVEIVEKVA
jgi:hypothetical protein